uniref:Carboxypeptidase Q n=1 Tax=Romanomermis culicivorax TaxID=13658 RepID=A0A915L522_ROMCU
MNVLFSCASLIMAQCLGQAVCSKIHDYQPIANQIIGYLANGSGRGQAMERLTTLTDTFGHRMVGEKSLDKAIDYLIEKMKSEGLNNVHKEIVHNLPLWVRGLDDKAILVSPRRQKLAILALGSTVKTPPSGLCARAIVVRDFIDLEKKRAHVKGRIVVYNQDWQGYGRSSAYRTKGASKAAAFGAVAVLVRSVTPHSIYTPHTGQQFYDPQVSKIPAASITVEDAQMLYRMQMKGQTIKICINISSDTIGKVDSFNTVAELTGSVYPNEIVMISGHLDSWDVGTGAMDDGGGVVTAWQALSAIKALGLKPKRTIRAVFWTAEEQGYLGEEIFFTLKY